MSFMNNPFDAPFAEIEFGAPFAAAAAPPAEPIAQRASDPIRQRFYEMRRLASGSPFGRNDAAVFYRQAKYMEDFEDGYDGFEPFSRYYPSYQVMGCEQLRTYFTWRARARAGEYRQTSLSYIYLHIYELISGVGIASPADGQDRLLRLWTAYRGAEPGLDNYLPQWLKDYHIYYGLPRPFAEFAEQNGLAPFYPEAFYTTGDLALWNAVSGYDVTKSKFCADGNAVLMRDCFAAAIQAVRESAGGFERLFLYSSAEVPWRPFLRALAYAPETGPDREAGGVPGGETYIRRDGRWSVKTSVLNTGWKELAAYLIKKTEACLREAVKYKFKIKAEPNVPFLPPEMFEIIDAAVERAVKAFRAELTRTVVTVDRGALARIRREALGTQEMLIVPDSSQSLPPSPGEAPPAGGGESAELQALAALLTGAVTLRRFAAGRGLMPEVLADGINEMAVDFFGDNILDDEFLIYDEYLDKAKEMVAACAYGK
jgi:hypothetical protein